MDYQERITKLEELLDHWPHYFEPASNGAASRGDGEPLGVALLSSMSAAPSVVELARCLGVCRQRWPGHYKHLRGHYEAEWRTVDAVVRVRNAHGKLVEKPARVRERVVPAWVVPRMVERAKDGILWVWRPAVKLELPMALYRAKAGGLREVTDSSGTHLTEAA